MDKIQCNSCGKNVVPKLWHYEPALSRFFIPLRYNKTQHLCSFCGACMYETGGQVTLAVRLVFIALVVPLVLLTLFFPKGSWSQIQWYLYAYWAALVAIFIYRKYAKRDSK